MDEQVNMSLYNFTTDILVKAINAVSKDLARTDRRLIFLGIGGGLMGLTVYKTSRRMARTEERLRRVQKELEDMKKSLRYAEEDA